MGFTDEVRRFLDEVAETAPPEIKDILFESTQTSLGRAIAADLWDAIPIVGDASNLFRVRHAEKVGITRSRRFSKQVVDLAIGVLPDPVGGILDLLTPTNTITYLQEHRNGQ